MVDELCKRCKKLAECGKCGDKIFIKKCETCVELLMCQKCNATKICSVCKVERSEFEFNFLCKKKGTREARCLYCSRDYKKANSKKSYERDKKKVHVYEETKECKTPGCGVWPIENFNKKGGTRREAICGKCMWKKRNTPAQKLYNKKWYEELGGREKCRAAEKLYRPIRNARNRERRKTDINYRIKMTVRSRIYDALIKNGIYRTHKIKYLGIDLATYRKWLESQFTKKMTWKNHGTYWHIDHVIPCDYYKFETKDDTNIYKCFNWKNTRPMIGSDNLEKSNKFNILVCVKHLININLFIVKNNIDEKIVWKLWT